MPGTNQNFSVHLFEITTLEAETLTGQTVAAELATFNLGPRTIVGQKAAQWREHPNTTTGRNIKVR